LYSLAAALYVLLFSLGIDIKRASDKLILLLDEPGLTLHAKAQYDLLRYFETELKGNHQLIIRRIHRL